MAEHDWRESAADAMVSCARTFYDFGWLLGTSGNLSIRSPQGGDRFLITASGIDKGQLSRDDFLLCDLDGAPVMAHPRKPSAEVLVHCAIYRAYGPEQAGAVFHVHEPFAALCSGRDHALGKTPFMGLEMIKGLDIWDTQARVEVPIVPNHADIPQLAQAVSEALAAQPQGPRPPGVVVDRHGLYAWGPTWREAKRYVESFAYLFRYSWQWGLKYPSA